MPEISHEYTDPILIIMISGFFVSRDDYHQSLEVIENLLDEHHPKAVILEPADDLSSPWNVLSLMPSIWRRWKHLVVGAPWHYYIVIDSGSENIVASWMNAFGVPIVNSREDALALAHSRLNESGSNS